MADDEKPPDDVSLREALASTSAPTSRTLTAYERSVVSRKAKRILMRRHFSEFVKGAWSELEGTTPLEWNDALQGLCDHVQSLAEGWLAANGFARRGQLERVMAAWARHGIPYVQGELLVQNSDVNMPPGSLKSRIIMVFFPAWMWLHAPRFSTACASSNDEVVKRDSDDCKKLVEGEWYRKTFGIRWFVRGTSASVGKWQTSAGGSRISRPMLAGWVGLHVDCVAGEALVATEVGDVKISDLHEMENRPRVWSRGADGDLVLSRVRASRRIPNRPVIGVCVDACVLRCTRDHRVATNTGYQPAGDIDGATVFVMRGSRVEEAIASVDLAIEEHADVYDLDVEGSHNFFAGGLLVHNCLLVDDPDDPLRVWSEPERLRVQYKFKKAFANRVNHEMRSMRVVTQQVVHGDCLCNNLRKGNGWTPTHRQGWATFCVPMEGKRQPVQFQGPTVFGWEDKRALDELLMPTRWPRSVLDHKRTHELGTVGYNAQYNQNAEVLTGGMFSAKHFRFFRFATDEIPPRPREDSWSQESTHIIKVDDAKRWDFEWLVLSVDANFGSLDVDEVAAQDDDRSAVGMSLIGGRGLLRFLVDDFTSVMGFDQTVDRIVEVMKRYDQCRRILVEKKANGSAIISRLERAMREQKFTDERGRGRSVVVEGFEPGANTKIARARTMAPDIEAGCWFVREGAGWLPDWFREVCQFPKPSVRDDRVDTMSQVSIHYGPASDALARVRAMGRW